MLMSGNGERVVFVLDAPGDESLLTGGSIARLLADGAEVTVLFGRATPDESDPVAAASAGATSADAAAVASARTALGENDPTRWRVLAVADQGADRRAALAATLDEANATAVVVAATDPAIRQAVVDAARAHGTPVFLSSLVSAADGHRLTAIDVRDHLDEKLAAIAAYPGRWRVDGRVVHLADGGEMLVTGSETYVGHGAEPRAQPQPPTTLSRLLASLMALLAGILFGVLGTVAHQNTLTVGSATIPIGLVLALIASGALMVGLRLVVHDRLVVLAAAIGLVGTIFLLSLRSTGGSVLVPAGVTGTVWTMVPALIAALVLAWPRIPARRRDGVD